MGPARQVGLSIRLVSLFVVVVVVVVLQLVYCLIGNSPMGEFGSLSPGKAICDRVALSSLRCMLVVLMLP